MYCKRFISVGFVLLACLLLALPVFAEGALSRAVDISKASFENEYSRTLLNAATDGTPGNGTKVTTWKNTGHLTQRWDYTESVPGKAQHYWLKNSANRSYAITCYGVDGQQVTLQLLTRNASTQAVKIIYETGTAVNLYGIANTYYLLAPTATGTYNGAPVLWKPSNGQNSQLWSIGWYA